MKKNIHPKVRQVVFKDISSDFCFLGTSTMDSKETIKWEDGKIYPLIKLEVSSASHPFSLESSGFPILEGASTVSRKNTERSDCSRRISRASRKMEQTSFAICNRGH